MCFAFSCARGKQDETKDADQGDTGGFWDEAGNTNDVIARSKGGKKKVAGNRIDYCSFGI